MPKNFNVDDAVMGSFNGLVHSMRAKRLSAELPQEKPKMNDEGGQMDEGVDDQDALEEMLGDYDKPAGSGATQFMKKDPTEEA